VYEIDPLLCPKCGYAMRVIAVITDPLEVNTILECLKRNNATTFNKGHPRPLDSRILSHSYARRNTKG
jgi:hypothetical protein